MKKLLVTPACALLFISITGFARISPYNLSKVHVNTVLWACGASYHLKGNSLFIQISQADAENNIDQIIDRSDIDTIFNSHPRYQIVKFLINHPVFYLFISGEDASAAIIPRVYYDHPQLNEINVFVSVLHENLLGNITSSPLLSFSMSRTLNNLINWNKFKPLNSPKVYPNYYLSKRVNDDVKIMRQEIKENTSDTTKDSF